MDPVIMVCLLIVKIVPRLRGFKVQPTDHYMRTFFMAMDKHVSGLNKKFCYKDTPRHTVSSVVHTN